VQSEALHEVYGGSRLLEWLKGAASALGNSAKKTVAVVAAAGVGAAVGAIALGAPGGGGVLRRMRPAATQRAGIFIGDVFAYLNTRGDKDSPGDIARIVRDALRSAAARRTMEDSKLVVVAHSLGGIIAYDILTHFDPAINVDAFVTVGSQVALFKELALYVEDKGMSTVSGLVSERDNIGIWINVFDPLDLLGFAADGVFAGVKDFAFPTQASPLDAHSTYFIRPNFHARLRARLAKAGLGVAA
jgi:pimeloyl-ACP methyl ester carboxylesterase